MRKFWQKKYVSKYTGKEIDDAVAKAGTALQNPMTAAGDLIVGGEDGAAGKLVKGTDGKVLKMVSGAPAWADNSVGMVNPMTTAGDIIVGGTDGAAGRLGKGTDGQVLSMVSGAPAWAAAQSGGALYQHIVKIANSNAEFTIYVNIFNTTATAITFDTLVTELNIFNTQDKMYPCTGVVVASNTNTLIVCGLYYRSDLTRFIGLAELQNTSYPDYTFSIISNEVTVADTVKQIM